MAAKNIQFAKEAVQSFVGPCQYKGCKEIAGLHFHHVIPRKDGEPTVSQAAKNYRKNELQNFFNKELSKCVILCRKHHNAYHHMRKHNRKRYNDHMARMKERVARVIKKVKQLMKIQKESPVSKLTTDLSQHPYVIRAKKISKVTNPKTTKKSKTQTKQSLQSISRSSSGKRITR